MAGGGARAVVLDLAVGIVGRAARDVVPGVKADAVAAGAVEVVREDDVVVVHCGCCERRHHRHGERGELEREFAMHLEWARTCCY